MRMRMPTIVIWGVCVIAHLSHAGDRNAPPDISRSVVKIIANYQELDCFQPWQKKPLAIRSGSGCIIRGKRILTSAHVIGDAIFTRAVKSGEGIGYRAQVLHTAHDCDLAVLTVEDERFWRGTDPLELGDMPKIGEHVAAYGFPIGGEKLSVTNGIVSRIELQEYSNSGMKLLAAQIDAALNPGNSGGPVMRGDQIVGIGFQVISADQADNIGYMIPPPIISRFLKDLEDGAYDGIPSLGIRWQKMESHHVREFYKMNGRTGVLVTAVSFDGTLHGHVFAGDVLLSVDGHKIDNDGTIPFAKADRICFEQVVAQKQLHKSIDVEILREGNILQTKCFLRRHAPLVPSSETSEQESYFIFGGLVFLPLTQEYVSALFADENCPMSTFEDMLQYTRTGMATQERRRVVVLGCVLPDEMNVGYHNIQNAIVTKVNGRTICDLRDLVRALADRKPAYHVIQLSTGDRVVLNAEECRKETKRIAEQFGIPRTCSDDLMAIAPQQKELAAKRE